MRINQGDYQAELVLARARAAITCIWRSVIEAAKLAGNGEAPQHKKEKKRRGAPQVCSLRLCWHDRAMPTQGRWDLGGIFNFLLSPVRSQGIHQERGSHEASPDSSQPRAVEIEVSLPGRADSGKGCGSESRWHIWSSQCPRAYSGHHHLSQPVFQMASLSPATWTPQNGVAFKGIYRSIKIHSKLNMAVYYL